MRNFNSHLTYLFFIEAYCNDVVWCYIMLAILKKTNDILFLEISRHFLYCCELQFSLI